MGITESQHYGVRSAGTRYGIQLLQNSPRGGAADARDTGRSERGEESGAVGEMWVIHHCNMIRIQASDTEVPIAQRLVDAAPEFERCDPASMAAEGRGKHVCIDKNDSLRPIFESSMMAALPLELTHVHHICWRLFCVLICL